MSLHGKLLQLMLVGLILAIISASLAAAEAMPGCPDKCGDVDIPYPFGTKEGCHLNDDFLITCNESSANKAPTPYLRESNIDVTKISLEGEIRVMQYISKDCYSETGSGTYNNAPSIQLSKFYISNTKNKFVTIGCDTYAIVKSYDYGGEEYTTGCMSVCNNISHVSSSCSGIGCCEVSIPKEIWKIEMNLSSFNNHEGIWDFNPCSYAFVFEENTFNFSASDLGNLQNTENLPIVLDWGVGNETCEVAQLNESSFACKENSTCIQALNGPGYLCKCDENYEGNPYLHGCQDIDECENDSSHQCVENAHCINTDGNYTCECPKDYTGDGRKDIKGCTLNTNQGVKVTKLALGIGIGVILLLVGSTWINFAYQRRKFIKLKQKFFKQNGGLILLQKLSTKNHERSTESTKIFTAEELEKATDNYNESRIIGQGGFGTVYKGFLANKSVVAIKKSKIVDQSQTEQFINEVVVLSQINHRNVVRLLGCCLETEVPLLVYEFVANGTLFEHIHDTDKNMKSPINWETRLRIATETAGVLSYMHSAAYIPIIHRDVKSTNILLDDTYTAKVSDFGTSRLVPTDENELSTMVQGTLGYLDPEYMQTSQLTDKSDVYSFGVVLVELLTGRKALSFDRPENERSLAMQFLAYLKEDRLFQVLEDGIVNERNIDHLKEVSNLAKRCLSLQGDKRPTMKEVTMELEGLRVMMEADHPWSNDHVELNSEEREYLLTEASSDRLGDGGSANISSTYDSIRNHVILAVADGR